MRGPFLARLRPCMSPSRSLRIFSSQTSLCYRSRAQSWRFKCALTIRVAKSCSSPVSRLQTLCFQTPTLLNRTLRFSPARCTWSILWRRFRLWSMTALCLIVLSQATTKKPDPAKTHVGEEFLGSSNPSPPQKAAEPRPEVPFTLSSSYFMLLMYS